MIRIFACLLFGLASVLTPLVPAQAQTIPVQSGDHVGFTRLVLQIGPDRDWDLAQQSETQWVVSLTPNVDGFDTSTVFDLIGRTRLASLSASEVLNLTLDCACAVTSFRHNDVYLVIDITEPSFTEGEATTSDPEVAQAEADRAEAAGAVPDLTALLASPESLPEVTPLLSSTPGTPADEAPVPENASQARLAEAAEIMAEQLARAAASGLLDASLREINPIAPPNSRNDLAPEAGDGHAPGAGDDHTATEIDAPPSGAEDHATAPLADAHSDVATTPGQVTPPDPNGHRGLPDGPLPIRAATGLDPRLEQDLAPLTSPDHAACQGAPLAASEWSVAPHVEEGLGALRLDLYDARDVLVEDAAIALAQHYLAFGFGAEAVYWLSQLQSPPPDLLHVAHLVDGAQSAEFPEVTTPEDCSDGELFWRYVAGAVTTDLNQNDTNTLQRAYLALPRPLRDQQGPNFARRLADDGHHNAARNVRETLHRSGRIDETTLRLLDLDLRIDADASLAQTQDLLTEALRIDGGNPAAIMTQALALDRRTATVTDLSRLTAADGLLREIGDGPETDDLWRETLLGLARAGSIGEALVRLGDPTRSDATREIALTDLIEDRVALGDTATLVVLAYTHGRNWRPEGSEAGRIQVRAVTLLREEGLFEAAQILRDVRRPLILPAETPPEPEPEDPAVIAWTQGDWPRLAETDAGTHAEIAARMARLGEGTASANTIEAPNLDEMFTAVSDSRALRQAVTDLLERPSLP